MTWLVEVQEDEWVPDRPSSAVQMVPQSHESYGPKQLPLCRQEVGVMRPSLQQTEGTPDGMYGAIHDL